LEGIFLLHQLKFEEKEDDCCPFFWDTIRMTDSAMAAVFNCSVAFYVSNGAMTAVFNRSITFYITNS
jgi:hypothetical protein